MEAFNGLPQDILKDDYTVEELVNDLLDVNHKKVSSEEKKPASAFSCAVCGSPAKNCANYGVVTCHSCRSFFRRTVMSGVNMSDDLVCKSAIGTFLKCPVNSKSWKSCKRCRFSKCLKAGMSPQRVKGKLPTELDIARLMAAEEAEKMTNVINDHLKETAVHIRQYFLSSHVLVQELVQVTFRGKAFSPCSFAAVERMARDAGLKPVFCSLLREHGIPQADINVRVLDS